MQIFRTLIGVIMTEFSELIDDIEQMPFENQEIFVDIINKRFAERKRERFIEEILESKSKILYGNFTVGNSEDLFKALNI